MSAPRTLGQGDRLVRGAHYTISVLALRNGAGQPLADDLENGHAALEVVGGPAAIAVAQEGPGWRHLFAVEANADSSYQGALSAINVAWERVTGAAVWWDETVIRTVDEAEWARDHTVLGQLRQGIDRATDPIRQAAGAVEERIRGLAESYFSTVKWVAIGLGVLGGAYIVYRVTR